MVLTALLFATTATAQPAISFDRVDIIAADSGTWVNYDLPMIDVAPTQTAIRWLTQVQVSWRLPHDLYVNTSLSSQSLVYDRVLWSPSEHTHLSAFGGIQTNTLIPRGVVAGVGWRVGVFRTSLGLSALSSATWKRPDYTVWHALPTLSIGFGKPL